MVLATLAALLLAPFVVQHRIDDLREHRTEVIQPARDAVSELHVSFAVQMAALRGFAIKGERDFLARYQQGVADERDALHALEPYTEKLGPEVAADFETVQSLAAQWNEHIDEAQLLEERSLPGDYDRLVPQEHMLYEKILDATGVLRDELLIEADQNRDEIEDAEHFALIITLVLVPLTVAAAGGLVWIGAKVWRLSDEAARGRELAERAAESKARMVRGLTHDLRNPLTVIDLSARRLEDDTARQRPDEAKTLADRIRRSVSSLKQTIDDLLEAGRRESGDIAIRSELVDVAALAQATVDDYRPTAEAGGLHLSAESTPDVAPVQTDPVRVREVLRNLLVNALRYTPEGGDVRVTVAPAEVGEAPGPGAWIALRVRDTGPGIPHDKAKAIFEEYTRLDKQREGYGLGLAISRRVAEILGGHLTVDSEPGAGSTFTLWLPAKTRA